MAVFVKTPVVFSTLVVTTNGESPTNIVSFTNNTDRDISFYDNEVSHSNLTVVFKGKSFSKSITNGHMLFFCPYGGVMVSIRNDIAKKINVPIIIYT